MRHALRYRYGHAVRLLVTPMQMAAYENRLRGKKLAVFKARFEELRATSDVTSSFLGAAFRAGDRVDLLYNGNMFVNDKLIRIGGGA